MVRFDYRSFPNIDDGVGGNTVMMIQDQDFVNVPPRQRPHWQRYEIPESEIK
jgi:hypothetical protein